MRVNMSWAQAKALGIVRCESCGYPPNNHFDHGKRLCAHDGRCTGFKPKIVLPEVTR